MSPSWSSTDREYPSFLPAGLCESTLDTYSHAIPAMQEEAAKLIAGLVFAE